MFRPPDLTQPPSRRRAVLWNVTGSWTSTAILTIQGLVLIPLYLHYLGERLYGFWLASGGILAWLAMVDVGGAAIIRQRCAAAFGRGDLKAVVAYFWHGATVFAGVIALFWVLALGVARWVPRWVAADGEVVTLLAGAFVVTALGSALHLANIYLRDFATALQRPQVAATGQAAGDLAGLLTTLVGLWAGWGLWALAVASVVRAALPAMGNAWYTVMLLRALPSRGPWSREIYRDFWRTSPAVLGAKATTSLTQHLPTVLLVRLVGPEATVAYTVSLRLLQVLDVLVNQLVTAYAGTLGHLLHDRETNPERRTSILRQTSLAIWSAGAAVGLVFLVANGAFVGLWTEPRFFLGAGFTAAAAVGSALLLINRLYEVTIGGAGALRRASMVAIAERSLRAMLMTVGIVAFGAIGAPLAIVAAGVVGSVLNARAARAALGSVADGLTPLRWAVGAQALVLLAGWKFLPLFAPTTWPMLILWAGAAGVSGLLLFGGGAAWWGGVNVRGAFAHYLEGKT